MNDILRAKNAKLYDAKSKIEQANYCVNLCQVIKETLYNSGVPFELGYISLKTIVIEAESVIIEAKGQEALNKLRETFDEAQRIVGLNQQFEDAQPEGDLN